MHVDGKKFRTIWLNDDGWSVSIIDQTKLPHEFNFCTLKETRDAAIAIKDMQVRGAPLIGITAAYGIALSMNDDPSDKNLKQSYSLLLETRPTAINLKWALDLMLEELKKTSENKRKILAYKIANGILEDDVKSSEQIGEHGLKIIKDLAVEKNRKINILTHCNAGWLATIDWGTATAPIYKAKLAGIPIHVWVDETRPRNQGSSLTAWELGNEGIDYTIVVDNAGGHLMQKGLVDVVITGSDRTTSKGDVCNKIGTYLKALAARENEVPFYVGLPSSTIDWKISDGTKDIPIELRDSTEVTTIYGKDEQGKMKKISLAPDGAKAANYAFDVTPSSLVTGLITERGVCDASYSGLLKLFPEQKDS
jgi:methylthioribose-1-phosphate isomerase